MKKKMLFLTLTLLILPAAPHAEDFLGAPLIPGGKIRVRTGNRMEITVPLSHEDTLAFYRKAFESFEDIKFRDWKDATYIEDDGRLPWHSITISKYGEEGGTAISIIKDNWTWIIGTLVLRFIGVFMVLLILFLGMSASGAIIKRLVKKKENAEAAK
jgi:hypothetical protein